ncbi:MAG: ZIP family metal transporter, partial [Bacilli bacterium]|nr:ZIP family metal transporter [Bacilli bacterium]
MFDFFVNLNPVVQALIATLFTWFVTLLGAALVYFFKNINKNIMDGMLGFSAGIMIAASFFSLLKPAGEMAENLEMIVWLVLVSGF